MKSAKPVTVTCGTPPAFCAPYLYTVIIPFEKVWATEWHPTDPNFAPISRGAFKTAAEAHTWAAEKLKGHPYTLETFEKG